ncbi:glycosyltransferase [Aquisalibacillus elongatus]|uniref:Glycosyltransferase involved in cell wall biosynthesis n=1 Tax=Aquisalibacillus elongatus TaxID=485577 RepID=A0A3N5C798_9BACI|nr:glycosyltransferase [Aquisalibacillus elongatus]RPF54205.1 glycosyltransferase involved in cell wall biosynthesis [Aquisalibacillus elongatus]
MHVFVIPSWYPTKENPIRGVFFKEQSHALQKEGVEVTVLHSDLFSIKKIRNKSLHKGTNKIIYNDEDGLPTYRYDSFNFLPRIPYFQLIKHSKQIRKAYDEAVKKHGKPDVIHAHSCIWGGIVASKIAEKENIPLVITEHSTAFSRGLIRKYQKPMIKSALNKAKEIIAVGPGLKKELSHYIDENKIKIIPNIVNTELFKPNTTPNKEKEYFTFFSVGLLTHKKGMDLLIIAFANAFDEKENVRLRIGGDGEELNNLKNLAKQLKVDHKISFLGRLDRNQVVDEMQNCDVFALASRHETFGVVYIEALACGKPILATKSGGPDFIVNEENGLLSNVGDINELEGHFKRMYSNYPYYSSDKIRENCINNYSGHVVAKNILAIYSSIGKVN